MTLGKLHCQQVSVVGEDIPGRKGTNRGRELRERERETWCKGELLGDSIQEEEVLFLESGSMGSRLAMYVKNLQMCLPLTRQF